MPELLCPKQLLARIVCHGISQQGRCLHPLRQCAQSNKKGGCCVILLRVSKTILAYAGVHMHSPQASPGLTDLPQPSKGFFSLGRLHLIPSCSAVAALLLFRSGAFPLTLPWLTAGSLSACFCLQGCSTQKGCPAVWAARCCWAARPSWAALVPVSAQRAPFLSAF